MVRSHILPAHPAMMATTHPFPKLTIALRLRTSSTGTNTPLVSPPPGLRVPITRLISINATHPEPRLHPPPTTATIRHSNTSALLLDLRPRRGTGRRSMILGSRLLLLPLLLGDG
jgi:hypothetical protein